MSGLFSAMNTNVQGLKGITRRVATHAQNIATAGATAAKERVGFMSSVNLGDTPDSFLPGGVFTRVQQFNTTVGAPTPSKVGTHMALSGQGYFVVSTNSDDTNPGQIGFSRVGTFAVDKDGYLRNHNDHYLKVFPIDSNGDVQIGGGDINDMVTASTSGLSGQQEATTRFSFGTTLPAAEAVGFSKTIPQQVVDSLGIAHTVNFAFEKLAAAQTWQLTITAPDGVVQGPYDAGIEITFDTNGNPTGFGGNPTPDSLDIGWGAGMASDSNITLDLSVLRSVGGKFIPGNITTDGREAGTFKSVSIDKDGVLSATFDNGESRPFAQIPLATFTNANGLNEGIGGFYNTTADSGTRSIVFANEGAAGKIEVANLESSTVDPAEVFTELIIDQQRYSANLRGISTIEEMMQSLNRALGA